jgi:GR25 family glycosyltransferase involved in LPS biosynthesis
MDNLVKKVLDSGGSITPLLIPSDLTNGTGLMNPSIYVDKGKLILNLRHVNYTLYHCEGEQLFINRWGPLSYLNPENDIHLRTTNWICELNDDLTIKNWNKVDTSKLDVEPVWEFIGLEDGRLVRWDDKLYLCGVRRDTKTNGEGRMELSELKKHKEVKRSRIEPPNDPNSYCEKNWMPIIDMPYHFVKWTNPTEVVKVNPETNTSETIILKEGVGPHQNLRGGSQIIPYGDDRICIIHEVDLWKNKLEQKDAKYTHRLVIWDKDWNIKHISEPFSFMGGEIEFCCGLAKYQDNLLITFGFQDNAAYILKMPITFLDNFIRNNKKLNGLKLANCISLESSKDRQSKTIDEFCKFGTDVKIIQAYDGRVTDYQNNPTVEGLYLHQMDSGAIATVLSHLKAIKDWYNTTNEDYGFFCEDDMLISNANNWLFNWDDVINNLPKGWKAIQLSVIKDIKESDMKLNIRKWDNWACGAYILSRTYVKTIIDKYYPNDKFILINDNLIPLVENIIYGVENKDIYTLPLFTEDISFKSTFYPKFIDTEYKNSQKSSADFIKNWWEKIGKTKTIKELCKIDY